MEELNRTNKMRKLYKRVIVIGVLALAAIILAANSIGNVPTNHTGILKRAGVVQQQEKSEGLFLKIPFVDTLDIMSNQVQTMRIASGVSNPTTSQTAETKDRQLIPVFEFEIQHQLDPHMSFTVYKNYGKNYSATLIESNAIAIIKQVFSRYNSEDIVTNKEQIPTEIASLLNDITEPTGISIVRVNMKTYDFTSEYTAILEERATLSAELKNNEIKQNNERIAAQTAYDVAVKKSEAQAETARIAAENARKVALIQAESDAEAAKIRVDNDAYVKATTAEAEKKARIAIAEAEQRELEARAAGLSDLVIQQAFIQKWDGKLIPSFGGGNGLTFTNLTDVVMSYLEGGN